MKTQYVTIPALQMAAAMYYATTAEARPAPGQQAPRCVDAAGAVVAPEMCSGDQPKGTYFFARGDPTSDTHLATREDGLVDSADPAARAAAGLPEDGYVTHGFGRRFCIRPFCNPDDPNQIDLPDIHGPGSRGG